MARSVTITTPIPSLEEVGKRLGMSKKRQAALLKLVYKRPEAASVTGTGKRTSVTTKKKVAANK